MEDREPSRDPLLVEPLEAAHRHLRRGPVAEGVRNAEPKGAAIRDAGRIDRCKQQRGALEVVARGQLELAVQIAPVGRQGGDGFAPTRPRAASEVRPRAALARPSRSAGAVLRIRSSSIFPSSFASWSGPTPLPVRLTVTRSSSPAIPGPAGPSKAAARERCEGLGTVIATRTSAQSAGKSARIRLHCSTGHMRASA